MGIPIPLTLLCSLPGQLLILIVHIGKYYMSGSSSLFLTWPWQGQLSLQMNRSCCFQQTRIYAQHVTVSWIFLYCLLFAFQLVAYSYTLSLLLCLSLSFFCIPFPVLHRYMRYQHKMAGFHLFLLAILLLLVNRVQKHR